VVVVGATDVDVVVVVEDGATDVVDVVVVVVVVVVGSDDVVVAVDASCIRSGQPSAGAGIRLNGPLYSAASSRGIDRAT